MSRIKAIIATFLLSISATVASADVIYLGAGGAKTGNPEISDAMPFSLGYISHAAENTILGFDIAQEGTMLDSTWGQNSVVSAALSVNLIYGYKISDNGRREPTWHPTLSSPCSARQGNAANTCASVFDRKIPRTARV